MRIAGDAIFPTLKGRLGIGMGGAGGGGGAASTWNPSDKTAGMTLSGANLVAHMANDGDYVQNGVRGTIALAGKQYWRIVLTDLTGTDPFMGFGIANSGATLTQGWPTTSSVVGQGAAAATIASIAEIQLDSAYATDGPGAVVVNDICDIAVDIGNLKFWMRKNGTGNWNASGTDNPTTNTGGVAFGAGTWYPFFGGFNGVGVTARFADDGSGTAPLLFNWLG